MISFLSPWLLLGLLVLPLLWLLLRLMPPAPKTQILPSVQLLTGHNKTNPVSYSAPWWLILLRLLVATLLVLAFAHPIYRSKTITLKTPALLVIQNDWAMAQNFQSLNKKLQTIIKQLASQKGEIILWPLSQDKPFIKSNKESDLLKKLPLLKPVPRAITMEKQEYKNLQVAGKKAKTVIVFTNGLQSPVSKKLHNILPHAQYLSPPVQRVPLVTVNIIKDQTYFKAHVMRAKSITYAQTVFLELYGQNNTILKSVKVTFKAGQAQRTISLDLPKLLKNRLTQVRVMGQNHAGVVALTGWGWQRAPIGIIMNSRNSLPYIDESWYLKKALSNTTRYEGSVTYILQKKVGIILWPDKASVSKQERQGLVKWVENGGIIVRFAGPNLAKTTQTNDALLAVPLQTGTRINGGTLQTEHPLSIGKFNKNSPLAGLPLRSINVHEQVLPRNLMLEDNAIWARLTDGTPLITARSLKQGKLIFIHTTANTLWSDFVLSGLFVRILDRLQKSAAGQEIKKEDYPLPLYQQVTAFGQLQTPNVYPLPRVLKVTLRKAAVSKEIPAGLYGNKSNLVPHNLGGKIKPFTRVTGQKPWNGLRFKQTSLMSYLLWMALILFLVDTLLRFSLYFGNFKRQVAIFFIFGLWGLTGLTGFPPPAQAQDFSLPSPDPTRKTTIAWIKTPSYAVNQTTQQGLTALSMVLKRRTGVDITLPQEIDLENDDIAPFPLIYWRLTNDPIILSPLAQQHLKRYLAYGGMIFFDLSTGDVMQGTAWDNLKLLADKLNLPDIEVMPKDYVLTRSYYLLQDEPGRITGGKVWIERFPSDRYDKTAQVIVGSNDYAASWALSKANYPLYPSIPGGQRQRELSLRFGVNLVVYSLTGQYKADAIHIPEILKRLKEDMNHE